MNSLTTGSSPKPSSSKATSHRAAAGTLPELVRAYLSEILLGWMKEWKRKNHIPPILLFSGPSGIGKHQTASELAQWILCEQNGFYSPLPLSNEERSHLLGCRVCSSCVRIQSGSSPDLIDMVFESEQGSGNALKIDQFRELKNTIGRSIGENQFKIIIIPEADRMTLQAAHSVLKLLEEPPQRWLFFLTANDPSLLLPTLVSRCQIVRLKPLSVEHIQELLAFQGVQPENKQWICATLAQGSWQRAALFAQDEIWEKRSLLLQFLNTPIMTLSPLMDWAVQEFSHFDVLLDLLEQMVADLVCWASWPTAETYPWRQSDAQEELLSHAQAVVRKTGSRESARSFWMEQAERCSRIRHDLRAPLNKKLMIQDLLLPWLEVQG